VNDAPLDAPLDRRRVVTAGHAGDEATARRGLVSTDPSVRASALGALERMGALADAELEAAGADPDPTVRRRVATLVARHRAVPVGPLLDDPDPAVAEVAAWAAGEHEAASADVLERLIALARGQGTGRDPLVRESAVAALGAIGADPGLDAILAATADKPAIRRRAVLALAPFLDPEHPRAAEVAAALAAALTDRDWQVRQAAEDLTTPP
jgi:HEAT repeat protein